MLASIWPDKTGQIVKWQDCPSSCLALALVELVQNAKRPLLVIADDSLSAQQLAVDIEFFQQDYANKAIVDVFADWETLPYDRFSPHQDIISDRLKALQRLKHHRSLITICALPTLMHRLPATEFIDAVSFQLSVGDKLDSEQLKNQLVNAGYYAVSQVREHGEFAVRGSIIDIFPMGCQTPFRLDLFDDEIDTIRWFDPDSQRSEQTVSHIDLLPAREFPIDESAINRFRQNFRAQFPGDASKIGIYQDVSEGLIPAGIEYYLPLFFSEMTHLCDQLSDDAIIIRSKRSVELAEQFWQEVQQRYEQFRHDVKRPILPPNKLYFSADETFHALKKFSRIELVEQIDEQKAHHQQFNLQAFPDLTISKSRTQPLAQLEQFLKQLDKKVLICAESTGRREVLLDLLKSIHIIPHHCRSFKAFIEGNENVCITEGELLHGLNSSDFCIIVENQLFPMHVLQKRRRQQRSDADVVIKDLSELTVGSPVVHIEHGIGRYQGLENLTVGGINSEFLALHYANNDKIYVPVTHLHLISRYSGVDPDHAPLHKLGSDRWNKTKQKAAEKISDAAAELLDIYAKRSASKGHSCQLDNEDYKQFVAEFPFEETPDQAKAIEAILDDMQSERAMDRLVCGDVGFGKTEVAMRAAFIAVQNQLQVAVLVPTTLLAEQHFHNFSDRFSEFPVNIELLSRFRSKKEVDGVIEGLANGKVDIVIGTHKLLQNSIKLKNLGLLIIDEEHRFGVKQKETLKQLRANVDLLTLTATPIPRTMNMSLSGLRDISLITTPPAKRLSIKTFAQEYSEPTVNEAILREIKRGGQVFYLHNDIKSMPRLVADIERLVPEAKVAIAHGQMRERELEQIMANFYHHRFNVLVCTTIIENGIDVPTANTILIDRADKFGLAQLHQLRGRVGRSHHQAYAYLFTPNRKAMTGDAIKRIDALTQLTGLGIGFSLASQDLEIRGAGELLGEDQSGQMQDIGFTLYMELLERAVKALKSGKQPDLAKPFKHGANINCHLPALIPEDYLPDVFNRLSLYKRIANAKDKDQLRELQVEMIDRFGLLPEATKNLFAVTELKLLADALGIEQLEARPNGGRVVFNEKPNVEPIKLIKLIQNQPSRFKLKDANTLIIQLDLQQIDKRISWFSELLHSWQ